MTASSFRTDAGLIVPAITTAQMREIDRVAIDELGPNLYQMMENAGRNLASLCVELLGDRWPAAPIVVLAGTGGNGGGGICAARHLANHGGNVTLVISSPSRLQGVPADQLALYRATGARVAAVAELDTADAELLVDAVLGYSLGGAPHGAAAELIRWMSQHPAPVVSLDVPSGVDSTTGAALGDHVRATHTMTLAAPKTGLDAEAVGTLWLADIGIPRQVYRRVGIELPDALFTTGYRVQIRAS
ncbi:NAD(P)H-hydrate epimerase [Salinibacterium sp. M195]|uniref:NAD(P)H-hydrate epimerase n=1 Tax=Salinibacterium sp. M195 TaxID=2583374 RepID=UPI001C624B1B|nr:NAD(P)H-hydrate epimerase [Salinibacterium sp. M195]QYH34660.1 NAD(P)H-hydrate epimerase [Salinibacterium sp. M195]